MFNCEYYNMNIQINDSENYYTIKFRYIKDLIDYIKLKEGNRLLINLKNIKKTSQYKRRVFNKGNSEIIKEIDNFYSAQEIKNKIVIRKRYYKYKFIMPLSCIISLCKKNWQVKNI